MGSERFSNVQVDRDERCTWITINRPDRLNALDRATMTEIDAAVQGALADAATRVLVLTGAGEKAFVAGADIAEMSNLDPREAQEFSTFLQACLDRIERGGKPVIAAVNGFALGGGCELALACHVRIAADTARFGQPEVNLGLIPGAGGTQRLARIVGRGRALDLILSGDMVDANEALRIGLVSRIAPAAELRATVSDYAGKLSAKAPLALGHSLQAVISGGEMPQADSMRFEAALFGLCFASEDMREGTRAFLDKRKAEFKGR